MKIVGSRAEVWHGVAKKTKGGLTKDDLTQNKYGRIVSKKRSQLGKRMFHNIKPFMKTKEQLKQLKMQK